MERQVVRKRTHNPSTPAKPLADRLRPLLPKPISQDDIKAIKDLAEIVEAVAAGEDRLQEVLDALRSLKPRFLEAMSWGLALGEVAQDLDCCSRTIERKIQVAGDTADRSESDDRPPGAASRPEAIRDEITARSVEIATARVGRWLMFHRRAETANEFTARSAREARRHFPPGKDGPHPGAAGHLLAEAASMGITPAHLSEILRTN